jgi:tRNA A64-2'-O-ribosylphosphate transferase
LNGDNGSAMLVDSTRRGKRIPDALSKTVPIWCAVINRVAGRLSQVIKNDDDDDNDENKWLELQFPKESVSPQEIAAINRLIPSFVRSFKVLIPRLHSISPGSSLIYLGMRSGYLVYLIWTR